MRATYADLIELIDDAKEAAATLQDLMDEVVDEYNGTDGELATLKEELERCNSIYNNLKQEQKGLINKEAFENVYTKLNFAYFFIEAVNDLKVAEKNAESAIMIDVLKTIYAGADTQLKALVDVQYAELIALEETYAEDLRDYADEIAVIIEDIDALYGKVATLDEELVALRDKYKTLNKSYKDFVKAATEFNGDWESLDKLVETVKKDVEVKLVELQTAIENLEISLKCEIDKAKANAIKDAKDYTDALANGAVKDNADAIAENLADINTIKELIGELPAEFQGDLVAYVDAAEADALKAAKDYVDGVVAALKSGEIKANADDIAALEAVVDALDDTYATDAQLAAVKAALEKLIADGDKDIKADLEAAVAKLNKTITIITIILAIVSAACVGAIVYIFLKKRA